MTEAEYDRILDSNARERAEIPVVNPDPLKTETHYGETLSGGDFSVAFYSFLYLLR